MCLAKPLTYPFPFTWWFLEFCFSNEAWLLKFGKAPRFSPLLALGPHWSTSASSSSTELSKTTLFSLMLEQLQFPAPNRNRNRNRNPSQKDLEFRTEGNRGNGDGRWEMPLPFCSLFSLFAAVQSIRGVGEIDG